jgi:hypothetical protein
VRGVEASAGAFEHHPETEGHHSDAGSHQAEARRLEQSVVVPHVWSPKDPPVAHLDSTERLHDTSRLRWW